MTPLRSWAHALGGDVSGRSVLCPGPRHSAKDRSLSVTISASSPDGFMVYSHAGDDWRECHDYVRSRLGLSPSWAPALPSGRPRKPAVEALADNRESALRLWRQSVDPRRTLIETYLRSRRLELPDEAVNEAVRFHPACPFGSERLPAMVCLVRDCRTDEPQAVHRTALAADGTAVKRNGKTFRLSLGPIAGGAIKLNSDDEVTEGLCIGEGVETCLAGRQMGLFPVWSLLSTSGIANFPILPSVDGLHIFRENDATGASAKAVEACARRWYDAGRDVVVVDPEIGSDLNANCGRRHGENIHLCPPC